MTIFQRQRRASSRPNSEPDSAGAKSEVEFDPIIIGGGPSEFRIVDRESKSPSRLCVGQPKTKK